MLARASQCLRISLRFESSGSSRHVYRSMATLNQFTLNSTATAIALVLPPTEAADINTIRSVHDKAFHKWPPHINILYPSLSPEQLDDAIPRLRIALNELIDPPTTVLLDRVGTFSHRRNVTVFLQPSDESETAISAIRTKLVEALGLNARAGTHDGTYRPHLTCGQQSLSGNALEKLVKVVEPLTGVQWTPTCLAVFRRKPNGEMEVINEIPLHKPEAEALAPQSQSTQTEIKDSVWTSCFMHHPSGEWRRSHEFATDDLSEQSTEISVLSYNLLADTFGCSFDKRLPLIISALESSSRPLPEVVCLQEVSCSMLSDILSHPHIRTRYPFSSHCPSSVLVNYLNLVTLSTKPFEFTFHHFEERHKSSLVVRPVGIPVEIANIHLTAALKDGAIAAKQRQIVSLTSFLNSSTKISGRRPLIAGDFNLATSSTTIENALRKGDISFTASLAVRGLVDPDIWSDAYLVSKMDSDLEDDGDGATFDVQQNPLAAESNAPADQLPQRYDRILFRTDDFDSLSVQSFHRFGLPDEQGRCGSDHFGIGVVLHLTSPRAASFGIDAENASRYIDTVQDQSDIEYLLADFIPSETQRQLRMTAIDRLSSMLILDARIADIAILPLGSFALDTYFPDSDVDVLIVGSLPPTAFFNIAMARLKGTGTNLRGLHYINALVPVIEVEILHIKFDVQYCQAPQILMSNKRYAESLNLSDQMIAELPPSALRPLNTFRDTLYLIQTASCLDNFRAAHRFLSTFFRGRGLYSAKFGYLGGVHLSLMLNHVINMIQPTSVEKVNTATLIRTFVEYYSQIQWEVQTICDPGHPHKDYRRTIQEPIVILAIHSPTARPNVASSCSKLSAQTISCEFQLAKSKLAEGNWAWLLQPPGHGFQHFLQNFGAFIVTSIDMWDLPKIDEAAKRSIIGVLESRVPKMMVCLGRIDGLHGQAWPYCLQSSSDEVEEGQQLKSYYLIGVSIPQVKDVSNRKLLQSKVIQFAQSHETFVQGHGSYDRQHMWIQVSLKSRKMVLDMDMTT